MSQVIRRPPHTFFLTHIPPEDSLTGNPQYVIAHRCDHVKPVAWLIEVFDNIPPGMGQGTLDLTQEEPFANFETDSPHEWLLALGNYGVKQDTVWVRLDTMPMPDGHHHVHA